MSKAFYSSRHFQVWTYSVSHCRLLLRSTKEGGLPSRIDVFFGGVDRMLLKPDYMGLRVEVADPPVLEAYSERYGEISEGAKLFTLEPDLASFVVAGVMQSHEDGGGFLDPSYFGNFFGA